MANRDFEAALERLLQVAEKDTGQSRRVADFLLSWWNADTCGGFDPTELWGLDLDLCRDVLRVLTGLINARSYPDSLGYDARFQALVATWRPHLQSAPTVEAYV